MGWWIVFPSVAQDLPEVVGIGIGGQLRQEIAKCSGLTIREIRGECEGGLVFVIHDISAMACCNRSSGRWLRVLVTARRKAFWRMRPACRGRPFYH